MPKPKGSKPVKRKVVKTRKTKLEAEIQQRLYSRLGGTTNTPTPAGNIDLLTAREVIEIKEVRLWKAAVGQVLCYSLAYPNHRKRIHLFKSVTPEVLKIIKKHCKKFGIRVTWEP